ncbi:hypothetical protein HNY73_007515 [Argiope bruennichi]|uniref:Uncharacterized protein n=1 Tax=Argiope bruennichi TaxID=94029 RepID=A0A8T0FGR4_ARGBR|nr:hypothetical protein HNY73_007515 [Argiope bruennichi]
MLNEWMVGHGGFHLLCVLNHCHISKLTKTRVVRCAPMLTDSSTVIEGPLTIPSQIKAHSQRSLNAARKEIAWLRSAP